MELKTYIRPLLKWWWLIVLATAISSISSYFAVRQQPPTYLSRTTIMIGRTIDDPNPSGNQFYLSQQLAQTYVDISRREPVRNATKEALGLDWLPQYSVNVVPNTQLIEISVLDTNPERSYAVASELANQLILLSPAGEQEDQDRQAFINQQLNDLQVQIEETKAEIEEQQEILGGLFSARQIADTQTQIAALNTKLNTLQANYAALLANTQRGAINALTIIEKAVIPTTPIANSKATTLLTAAAIGFVLAVSAAYLLEYLDDSVKTVDDILNAGGIHTLASIPAIKNDSEEPKVVTIEEPRSPISESFRILRTNLNFSSLDNPRQKLLITSPNPGEGKTMISANLATVIAQSGYSVLLIDADLRRPRQHNVFKLRAKPGLAELLLEMKTEDLDQGKPASFEELIQESAVPNLSVLTSGVIPHNPSEVLGSIRMKAAIDMLATHFDYLIVDSPPVLSLADSLILSGLVDGVIIAARTNRTKQKQLKMTINRLKDVEASLVGTVLNGVSLSGGEYANYYYYQQDDKPKAAPPISQKLVSNGNGNNEVAVSSRKRKKKTI